MPLPVPPPSVILTRTSSTPTISKENPLNTTDYASNVSPSTHSSALVQRLATSRGNVDSSPSPLLTLEQLHEGLRQDRLILPLEDSLSDNRSSPASELETEWKKYLDFSPGSNERILIIPIIWQKIEDILKSIYIKIENIPTLDKLSKQIAAELEQVKVPIEPDIDFLWIGSLPEEAKSYMRLHLENNPNLNGLTYHLGYDPRGYMAHELKSAIYHTAQAHVNDLPPYGTRSQLYYKSVLQLQNEVYEWMKPVITNQDSIPNKFNQRAIDFMVQRLGRNRQDLEKKLQTARNSFRSFESEMKGKYGERFQLVDLQSSMDIHHPIYKPYMQEMWLRQNLASAGDLGRSVLLDQYGGTYLDVDVGPLIRNDIFGDEILKLEKEIFYKASSIWENWENWEGYFIGAKFQAILNFIAKRNPDKSGLKDNTITNRMMEDIFNEKTGLSAHSIQTSNLLLKQYLDLIQIAPEKYINSHFSNTASHTHLDIERLFQPLQQPKIFPNGISIQGLPSNRMYNNNVVHMQKGAKAARIYWKIVKENYRLLEENNKIWDKEIPNFINIESAAYRLDGLHPYSRVTVETTGPKIFAQAAYETLLENIQDDSLEKIIPVMLTNPVMYLQFIKLILSPRVVTSETPEDAKSSWTAPKQLPKYFEFWKDSKYDRQIVIQWDDNRSSNLASRYFNNRHKNSIWLKYDFAKKELLWKGQSISKLKPEWWGERTRLVIVVQPTDEQAADPKTTAQWIKKIIPSDQETKPIARMKLVWQSPQNPTPPHDEVVDERGETSTKEEETKKGALQFAGALLKELKKEGVGVQGAKVYGGPVEVDVMGRTWVIHSETGLREHHSSELRYLVQLDVNHEVQVEPVKNNIEVERLKKAPAFHSGEASRKAVILVVPEKVLKNNEPTDKESTEFHEVMEGLWREQPQGGFYAMSQSKDGEITWWEYDPSERTGWTESWKPLDGFLSGRYAEMALIGHGNGNVGAIENIPYPQISEGLAKKMKKGSKIDTIKILSCDTKDVFGTTLAEQLAERGIDFSKIMLSEYLIYIRGKRILYQVDEKQAKEISILEKEGTELKMTKRVLRLHEITTKPRKGYIGPFEKSTEYAWRQQERTKVKAAVTHAMGVIKNIGEELQDKAALRVNEVDSEEYVPLLDQIKQEGKKAMVSVVPLKKGNLRDIEISQERLAELREAQETLKIAYKALNGYVERGEDGSLKINGEIRTKSSEEGGEDTGSMDSAFFLIALLSHVKNPKISNTEKLSVYWNLAGLGVAQIGRGVNIAKMVTQWMAEGGAIEKSLGILGRAFKGANVVFMAGTVGLNIYNLTTTKDPVERVGLKIGLGFNLPALGLTAGSTAVNFLLPAAAATAGAVGSLALPLAGLGFGFSALGKQIAGHNKEVHAFYDMLMGIYRSLDARVYTKNSDGILIPATDIPISEINYRTRQITLGEVRLRSSRAPKNWIQKVSGAAPEYLYTSTGDPLYFNILKQKVKTLDASASTIVLSDIPPADIDYEYVYSATSRSAEEERTDERLQTAGKYAPSNFWKNLRPKAKPLEYRQATQKIILDANPRVLIFPPKPNNVKVAYSVEGGGGTTLLKDLHSEINLTLTDTKSGSYILEVPGENLLRTEDVTIVKAGNQQTLTLQCKSGRLAIDISGLKPDSKIRVIGNAATWEVDLNSENSIVSAIDLRRDRTIDIKVALENLKKGNSIQEIVAIIDGELPPPLKENASTEEKAAYPSKLLEAEKSAIRCAYDQNQILTPGENYPVSVETRNEPALEPYQGMQFVGLTEKHAYFYNTETQILIQTDRFTNRKIETYSLKTFAPRKSRVEGVFQVEDQIIVKQVTPLESGKNATFIYEIQKGTMQLMEVSGLDSERFWKFENFSNIDPEIRTVRTVLDRSDSGVDLPEEGSLKKPGISGWIKIQGTNSEGNSQTQLVDLEKGYHIPIMEDTILIRDQVYEPPLGRIDESLLLWSPKTKIAQFKKLHQGAVMVTHSLAEGQAVQPFQNAEGLGNSNGFVTLVTEDGKQFFIVNSFGSQMKGTYQFEGDEKEVSRLPSIHRSIKPASFSLLPYQRPALAV